MPKNSIITYAFLFLLSTIVKTTFAFPEGKCGETIFLIQKIAPPDDEFRFELYYKINDNSKKLLYTSHADMVDAMCVKEHKKHPYLLLQERCSGSACTDEGQFKVFDPYSKKIIIDEQPMTSEDNKGTENPDMNMASKISLANHDFRNQKLVEKFLGTPLPIVRENKEKFCCDETFNGFY